MLELKIKVKNKAEAQKIVADLGLSHDIKQAKYKDNVYIFGDKKKTKYFLKKHYFDFEKGKIIDYEKDKLKI